MKGWSRVFAGGILMAVQAQIAGAVSHGTDSRQDVREGFPGYIWKYGGGEMPYRIHLPEGYDGKKKYPLVLFLHGAGERGSDNWQHMGANAVWRNAWTNGTDPGLRDRVIILAPQCPANRKWVNSDWSGHSYDFSRTRMSEELKAVHGILMHVLKTRKVDRKRLYITGLSMGGYGTWDMIMRYPDLFAAAAPVCGGGSPAHAGRIAAMPIWVFHGADDEVVPAEASRMMVEALKKVKSSVKYTEYSGVGHDSWTNAYSEPGFVPWFLGRKRK